MLQRSGNKIWDFLISPTALVIFAGVTCFVLAVTNIAFAMEKNFVSIWLVNAVLLIFIFRSSADLAWEYFIAGLVANILANYLMTAHLQLSIAISLSNSIEILIPILLVPRHDDDPVIITGFNRQLILLAVSIMLGCFISSITATFIYMQTWNTRAFDIAFNWYTIDMLAMLAILPVSLAVTNERIKRLLRPGKLVELLMVTAIALTLTWISMRYIQIRFIIILIPLLYGTFRLGLLGTAFMCFCITTVYTINLIVMKSSDLQTTPELISISYLLMGITLIPALITAILIEERDRFARKLRENEARFRSAIQYSAIGMSLVSPTGKWELVNPALCEITGYKEEELLKMHLHDVTDPDDQAKDDETIAKISRHEIASHNSEKHYIKKNGEKIWVSQVMSGIYNANLKIINFVVQVENITLRKRLQAQLKSQATHDVLTGLINRRDMETKIRKLLASRVSQHTNVLLFIDLDNFKIVNDSAGHAAGDEMLRQVAELLSGSVRQTDYVARFGGDEFAVLLPECSLEISIVIANNIIDSIKRFEFQWHHNKYKIGCSIGLISFKSKEMSLEALMNHVDVACYAAKNRGGNCVNIYESVTGK